jgi:CRP-like cAMP-binding protein
MAAQEPQSRQARFAAAPSGRADMDITPLVRAIEGLPLEDRFAPALSPAQWQQLGASMARRELRGGELLLRQGERDRCAYLVEEGLLQVFVTGGPPGSHRIATLRPGALFGEPALFTDAPRMAHVEAMTPCVVWALQAERLMALAEAFPQLVLTVLQAAGAVMAVRMRANLERGLPAA